MPVTKWKFIGAGLLISTGALMADALWAERFFIETNEFYIAPATRHTENIRIIQISDLHLQSLNYRLTRLANKINKSAPDLVLFTGDSIDKAKSLPILNTFLKLIDKHIRKVAILGNWEYQGKIDLVELKKIYAANNCSLLVNQSIRFSFQHKTISITGLDDFLHGINDIDKAMKEYIKSDYHILLAHCPQYRDQIAKEISKKTKVDFILSGHTHGGQANLFGFIPYLPRGSGGYLKGWYNNSPKLYVSKGIGTVFLPIRFRARAEIAIFNLAIKLKIN